MERTVNARHLRTLLLPLLILPALGYLWPQASLQDSANTPPTWSWPKAEPERNATPLPNNMDLFWPSNTPSSDSQNTDTATAQSDNKSKTGRWSLVGVIRQGTQLNALLQDPKQNILTLKLGDMIDKQRKVNAIHPTQLTWQDNEGKTGVLLLYPNPATE